MSTSSFCHKFFNFIIIFWFREIFQEISAKMFSKSSADDLLYTCGKGLKYNLIAYKMFEPWELNNILQKKEPRTFFTKPMYWILIISHQWLCLMNIGVTEIIVRCWKVWCCRRNTCFPLLISPSECINDVHYVCNPMF